MRAESDHVVVFGQGSQGDLERISTNLERLHGLMSRIYMRGKHLDDGLKIQVTLIESRNRLRALKISDLRTQEGPFPDRFSGYSYFDPRESGEVIAVARTDQIIDLNTNRRFNLDCDDYHAEGGTGTCGSVLPRLVPVVRSWESVLYAKFAQHFILKHAPAAYPRWYLDGIGALWSAIDMHGDGSVDYACAPPGYREVFKSFGYPDIGAILRGDYLDSASKFEGADQGWSPYGAWLIAHYFLFSVLKPDRRAQFDRYMAAIRQGVPMAEAADVFGDMRKLQRDIAKYGRTATAFARTDASQAPGDPLITILSAAAGALVEARIELDSRLAQTPTSVSTVQSVDTGWFAPVRDTIARLPYDQDALLFAAEVECRSGHHDECLAIADRILARSPDSVDALAWKGVALTDQAVAGRAVPDAPAVRSATLAAARGTIERAVALDDQAPRPLIAWFQSFTKAGERVPEPAMRGMAMVIRAVPAAPAPRLYLAQELVRQGQADLARRVLFPVLYGAYDSPEKTLSESLFTSGAGKKAATH